MTTSIPSFIGNNCLFFWVYFIPITYTQKKQIQPFIQRPKQNRSLEVLGPPFLGLAPVGGPFLGLEVRGPPF